MNTWNDTWAQGPGVLLQGLALSLSLIMAIGAQNAFVLRQGLRREHVGSIVLVCAVSDALLISAGVLGLAQLIGSWPGLARLMAWVGAAFVFWYGSQALWRARQSHRLEAAGGNGRMSRAAVLTQALAFTYLNPHVYLDTVMLMGSIGAQHSQALRPWFIAGASSASLLWFVALGFGARWLSPWFARPRAWQILDGLIGLTMWAMALMLLRHGLNLST